MASSKARASSRPSPGGSGRMAAKRPVPPPAVAEPAAAEPAPRPGPPLWLQITSLVLAVLGLAVSAYETYAHYDHVTLAGCPTGGGTFNCTAVITSDQSMVFGVIPVAVLGVAFYVFAIVIMTPWAWQARRPEIHLLRLASLVVGMGFVLYLIYAELYQIGQVCEYCTGVHVITFLLFCITVFSFVIWGLGARKDADAF